MTFKEHIITMWLAEMRDKIFIDFIKNNKCLDAYGVEYLFDKIIKEIENNEPQRWANELVKSLNGIEDVVRNKND